jgi:hypothetical protein
MVIMRNIITVSSSSFVNKNHAKTASENIFSKPENNLNRAPRRDEQPGDRLRWQCLNNRRGHTSS